MNDTEMITAVRDSVADIHSATPVAHIIKRGRAVRTRRRIPVVAGALAVAAGAALAVSTLLPSGASPAYALTQNADGTVTLAVYRHSGIAQVNARLRELGDNVYVVPVEPGCPPLGSLPPPPVPLSGHLSIESGRSISGSVTVNAQGVPAGDILVVGFETSVQGGKVVTEGGSRLTSPPPPSCVSMPPPPTGGPGSGTVGG